MNDLFESTPRLSRKDRQRFAPHLQSWQTLNELFLFQGLEWTVEDLKKLILLEVEGSARPEVIQRLFGRLQTVERTRFYQRLNRLRPRGSADVSRA